VLSPWVLCRLLPVATRNMKRWEPEELKELCALCGLTKYTAMRRGNFIFLSASKAAPQS